MEFPDDRLYSKEGFWVMLDGDIATIGISDWLQDQLGGLIYIQYNDFSDDEILVIQSVTGDNPFPKPLAGSTIEDGWNGEALEAPFNINNEPYGEDNWLYKLKFAKSAAANLMTAGKFRALVGQ
jgi:glycine cleavage system H protein